MNAPMFSMDSNYYIELYEGTALSGNHKKGHQMKQTEKCKNVRIQDHQFQIPSSHKDLYQS